MTWWKALALLVAGAVAALVIAYLWLLWYWSRDRP